MATTSVLINKPYADLDLDFIAHPATHDIVKKKDAEAVKRSIRNLVFTQFYERPFHPEIGCQVYGLLFEPMTQFTAIEIQKAIIAVIENYEPRAILRNVYVVGDNDNNQFEVNISFTVKNVSIPVELSFYLIRTR